MHFPTTVALVFSAIHFSTAAPATVSCAVCAPTIIFEGLTRTLTLVMEEEGNTVQCNYDTPAISGFNPACLYQNVNGEIIFTNTGASLTSLPGACPATLPLVQQTECIGTL